VKAAPAKVATTTKAPAKAADTKGKGGKKEPAKASEPKKVPRHVELKKNPWFERRPRVYSVGGAIQPKQDLGRVTKWPKYVRLQRQKRVLYQRLKVPPAINQFTQTADKNLATEIFKLLNKYRPESHIAKKQRLQTEAEKKAADPNAKGKAGPKPINVKFGLNHITALIEAKKTQLVVIAHDVEPIEIVVWLPALCRKLNVPYVIVKSKSRLGQLVHKKSATAVAITAVRPEDNGALDKIITAARTNFNDRVADIRKTWGGGVMGLKTRAKLLQYQRKKEREALAKATA